MSRLLGQADEAHGSLLVARAACTTRSLRPVEGRDSALRHVHLHSGSGELSSSVLAALYLNVFDLDCHPEGLDLRFVNVIQFFHSLERPGVI